MDRTNSVTETMAAVEAPRSRVGRKWLLLLGLLAAAAVVLLFVALRAKRAVPPPLLFQLPAFDLVDQRARPFGSKELEGKVWIGNFIFTTCPTICPRLMTRMAEVQGKVRSHGDAVRLVSFSVDPVNDTPARLAEWARRYGADDTRWSLLTGPLGDVERAVKGGFKQAMERKVVKVKTDSGERELLDIVHAPRFVLVDAAGGIRGFYDTETELDRLLLHVALLVQGRG